MSGNGPGIGMAITETRPQAGQRPYSAGDGAQRRPLSGEWLPGREPPPPPFRRDSSLERGIIGAPPPLVRDSDHRFTAAEVERLLAVRDKKLLSVKRRLYGASKKNDALESAVKALKETESRLRQMVKEGTAKQDELHLHVSELEDVIKRKTVALKTSNHRRERAEERVKTETAQARIGAELARSVLEEAGRKSSALRERAEDAETRVESLERRLEVSETQAAEAKRLAEEELVGRVSAHQRDRATLEAAVSKAEEEALEGLRHKQEAERQTDKVVRELQAWRERVTSGDIVEMSSSEAKRLRWSEEQVELMKEANANLRSQLLESGRLLAEAEHSFETVTAGFGDARGTIAGLSARLDQKTKSLLEAERGLRVSKAEVNRLKKGVEADLDGEGKGANHARQNTGLGNETNQEASGSKGERRSDLPPREKVGLEMERSSRSLTGKGASLNLSNVGVNDETLDQDQEINEVGELLDKRIEALELALNSRGDR
eukprot:g10777.t1